MGAVSLRKVGPSRIDRLVLGASRKRCGLLGAWIRRLGLYADVRFMGSPCPQGGLLRAWILWPTQREHHQRPYDHHQRELEEKLTDYQHQFLDAIVSALHVHLDAHLCLEVLILRGKAGKVKRIADRLIATKGVKHGKLVLTSKDPIPY